MTDWLVIAWLCLSLVTPAQRAKAWADNIKHRDGSAAGCFNAAVGPNGLFSTSCPAPFSPYGVVFVGRCSNPAKPEIVWRDVVPVNYRAKKAPR